MRNGKIKLDGFANFLGVGPKTKAGITRRRKKNSISKLDVLDKKSETQALQWWEIDLEQTLKSRLIQLLREEEIKWYQRGKTLKLLFRDMNTKYFHLVANGKHRKTRIFQLVDGDKIIQGDEELKNTLQITIVDYLALQTQASFLWMRVEEMIFHR